MRLSGTLRSWNDERGFGLIAQSNRQADIFLHISALPRDGSRPTVGERLTFEMGRGNKGKPQAVNVIRQALAATTTPSVTETLLPIDWAVDSACAGRLWLQALRAEDSALLCTNDHFEHAV